MAKIKSMSLSVFLGTHIKHLIIINHRYCIDGITETFVLVIYVARYATFIETLLFTAFAVKWFH